MSRSAQYTFLVLSAAVYALLLSTGCAGRADFTDSYRERLEGPLNNVQFYISDGIVLRRIEESLHKTVAPDTHSLRIAKKKKLIEVEIPRGTPGILRLEEAETLAVQFEPFPPGEEMVIPFTRTPRSGPEQGLVYSFRNNTLRYQDKTYQVFFRKREFPVYTNVGGRRVWSHNVVRTSFPVLQINPVEQFAFVEKQRRTAPGLRLE